MRKLLLLGTTITTTITATKDLWKQPSKTGGGNLVETWCKHGDQIACGFLYGLFVKMMDKNTLMRFPPSALVFIAS